MNPLKAEYIASDGSGVIPPEISFPKMIGIKKQTTSACTKMELKGDDHAAAGLYRPGL